jgi:hypothetical protein
VVVYKTYGLCFSNNFAKTYHCLKQTLWYSVSGFLIIHLLDNTQMMGMDTTVLI